MNYIERHLIGADASVRDVLERLDELAADAIIFLVDDQRKLIGSITDGDIRRGLIKGLTVDQKVTEFIQPSPKFFRKEEFNLSDLINWRSKNYKIIPVLDGDDSVCDVVNFRLQKSYLPIDAIIMAGGKGTRLRPLTLDTPKPLLKVDGKPIIEYNVDRLKEFGIRNLSISINYLGEQLISYFQDGSQKEMNIKYIEEAVPLGTIGAARQVEEFFNDYVLVMNSDLLTNIDFEEMFHELVDKNADMVVATVPYEVNIPYGVIELEGDTIINLKEKPTYTYYSNAGIYIFKKEHIQKIPQNEHFNATDLMEALYSGDGKVIQYPILDYWLDIGKHHDFDKAQKDVKHIKF